MTSPEILPCPFCGGECDTLHLENFTGTRMYSVTCVAHMQDCKVRGCQYESARNWTESEAITAHNRVAGSAGLLAEARELLARVSCVRGADPDLDDRIYATEGMDRTWDADRARLIARIDALEPEA